MSLMSSGPIFPAPPDPSAAALMGQKYSADQQLQAQKMALANALQLANITKGTTAAQTAQAQRAADQQLQASMAQSGASKYVADQNLAGNQLSSRLGAMTNLEGYQNQIDLQRGQQTYKSSLLDKILGMFGFGGGGSSPLSTALAPQAISGPSSLEQMIAGLNQQTSPGSAQQTGSTVPLSSYPQANTSAGTQGQNYSSDYEKQLVSAYQAGHPGDFGFSQVGTRWEGAPQGWQAAHPGQGWAPMDHALEGVLGVSGGATGTPAAPPAPGVSALGYSPPNTPGYVPPPYQRGAAPGQYGQAALPHKPVASPLGKAMQPRRGVGR